MNKIIKQLLTTSIFLVFIFALGSTFKLSAGNNKTYIIYSGYTGGTYSSFALSMKKYGGIKLKKKYSKGSLYNLDMLMDNKGHFGIAQLDIYGNYLSKNSKAITNLKLVIPLYTEEFHILTTNNFKKLKDLKNKTISIGTLESGSNPTARIILSNIGLEKSYFNLENSKPTSALASYQKNGYPEAVIFVGGAPVSFLNKLKIKSGKLPYLLSLEKKHISILLKNKPGYKKMIIPKNTYPWQKKAVHTVGIISVLFCRYDVDHKTVNTLVNNILKNKTKLEKEHVKWKEFSITKAKFLNTTMAGLIHPAAEIAIKNYKP